MPPMIKPKQASNNKAWRQPKCSDNKVKGVCATMPPVIAMVTIKPATKAMRCEGNQRDAKRILLKKQNALPIPLIKRNKLDQANEYESANKAMPRVQVNKAVKIIKRVEKRSSNVPAIGKNIKL